MIRICKECGFILGTRPNLKEKDGVCLACINNKVKRNINWDERQAWLTDYIKENITNPEHECVVAVSGGKDSCTIVKRLVENHGIKNPLLVYVTNEFTQTKAGQYNLDNLCKTYNCDLITYRIAPKTFIENVKKAFIKYVKLLPENGHLIINADDTNCLDLPIYSKAPCIKYGIENEDVDFSAKNIVFDEDGFPEFDVYKYNEFYEHMKLSIPGKHNVLNALACISLCDAYNISKEYIKSALLEFKGADRRFEFKGLVNGAKVYDDYAHHPTEILATAKALKNKKYNQSWVVFQPHTYSRTYNLLKDFANTLLIFDNIIITDIYAAREKNTYDISSKDLVDEINNLGKSAIYIPKLEDCATYLKENVKKDDIVLTLGAGTVTNIGPMIIE